VRQPSRPRWPSRIGRCKLLPLAAAVRRGHAELAELADRFLVAKLLICFRESASLRHRGFFLV